jgi:hypothetical protein
VSQRKEIIKFEGWYQTKDAAEISGHDKSKSDEVLRNTLGEKSNLSVNEASFGRCLDCHADVVELHKNGPLYDLVEIYLIRIVA